MRARRHAVDVFSGVGVHARGPSGGVKIPVVSGNTFATLLIGYVILLAGNIFKGV